MVTGSVAQSQVTAPPPPQQGVVQALVLPTMGLVQPISINLSDLQNALKAAVEGGGVVRQVLAGVNGLSAKVIGQGGAGPRTQTLLVQSSQQPQLLSAFSLPLLDHDGTTKIIINYSLDPALTPALAPAAQTARQTGAAGQTGTAGQTVPVKLSPTQGSDSAPGPAQSVTALVPLGQSTPGGGTQPAPVQIRPAQSGLVQLSLVQSGPGPNPVLRPAALAQLASSAPCGPPPQLLLRAQTGSSPRPAGAVQITPQTAAAKPNASEPQGNASEPQNPVQVVQVKVEPADPESAAGEERTEEEEE